MESEVSLSLNLQQKEAVVAEVAKQIAGAQAIILAENRGMSVADVTQLRAKARASGIYFRVVKNTLVRRAVADTPFASLADKMSGPLAYGIGTDPVAVAKVLNDFAKGNEKFVIRAGAMPGQVMSAKDSRRARLAAVARGAARQAGRHDAGADREVRPDAERGAVEVRAHGGRRSRQQGSAADIRIRPNHPTVTSRSNTCPQCKPKSSTRSRR